MMEWMELERKTRPIPIKEFVDGLRRGGFIKQWELLDDEGLVYKITFNKYENENRRNEEST